MNPNDNQPKDPDVNTAVGSSEPNTPNVANINQFSEADPLQTNFDAESGTSQLKINDPWQNQSKSNEPSTSVSAATYEPLQTQNGSPYPPYQPSGLNAKVEDTSPIKFDNPPGVPKKSFLGLKLFLGLLTLLILLAGSIGGMFLVAYDKVQTPLKEETQEKISNFIQSLPYTPKTAKYLLMRSAVSQVDVKSGSFDLSAALNFSETDDVLGLNSIDFTVKGVSDISDQKNIQTSFNMSITKDFNMDFRKKDKMLYFKINKLPSFLFAFAGIDVQKLDPVLNQWVSYDTTPLDTEARKLLDDSTTTDEVSEVLESEQLEKVFDKKILDEIKVTNDTLDSYSVYKLLLSPNDELLDHFFKKVESELTQGKQDLYLKDSSTSTQKMSDVIKNAHLEIMIDKNDYYTRKMSLSFDMVNNQKTAQTTDTPVLGDYSTLFSTNSKASFALVVKFDDFGKPVTIEIPTSDEGLITFEQFSSNLSEIFASMYGSSLGGLDPVRQLESAKDAQRKNDLQNLMRGLEAYNAEYNEYPQTLDKLVESGLLAEVPTDPEGTSYYYKVTADNKSFDLCAKLSTPDISNNTCPDTSYNYHITPSQ